MIISSVNFVQLSQFLASRETDQFTLKNPMEEDALENTLTYTETIDPQIVVKSKFCSTYILASNLFKKYMYLLL